MAGFTSGGDDDVLSNINVTPLVDVVLVLLIIFIVTASLVFKNAIEMKLPEAQSGEQAASGLLNLILDEEIAVLPCREFCDRLHSGGLLG